MAGLGYTTFVAGNVLTAAQLNGYLMQQSVPRFADKSTKDTAFSSVSEEGMLSYNVALNSLAVQVSGTASAQSTIGPVHGALTSWTPVVTQSNTPTLTVNEAAYQRVGRWVTATATLTVTSAGTATNDITISLPVNSKSYGAYSRLGVGSLTVTSTHYPCLVAWASASTVKLASVGTSNAQAFLGNTNSGFASALANGNIITVTMSYEAASDA